MTAPEFSSKMMMWPGRVGGSLNIHGTWSGLKDQSSPWVERKGRPPLVEGRISIKTCGLLEEGGGD